MSRIKEKFAELEAKNQNYTQQHCLLDLKECYME